ncbi:MAG TPA: hypothetical protein VGH72_33865 [Pseudonocardia sp.]|jgi:hypothetical protein
MDAVERAVAERIARRARQRAEVAAERLAFEANRKAGLERRKAAKIKQT